jgi:hypothetical protein
MFLEEPCLSYLREAKIALCKTPASCSAVSQPSDVSPFFKASKRKFAKNADYIQDQRLTKILTAILDKRTELSAAHRSRYIEGLGRLIAAVSCVYNKSTIRKGYSDCGQFPFSLEKAMAKCSRIISAVDLQNMKDKLTDLAAIYTARGLVTEEEMDALNIVSVNDEQRCKKPKDQRVLHRQRAVHLNHGHVVLRQEEYRSNQKNTGKKRKAPNPDAPKRSYKRKAQANTVPVVPDLQDAQLADPTVPSSVTNVSSYANTATKSLTSLNTLFG